MRSLALGLVVLLALAGCGGGDEAASPPAEASTPTDAPAAAGGNCTATGTLTGGYEATLTEAEGYSSFSGTEGAYGVTVADDVALDAFFLGGGEATVSLTGPGLQANLRQLPGEDEGIGLAADGSGGTLAAELAVPSVSGGDPVRVDLEVTCS